MKMSITRNVILDLLPLYLAGEASEDTREVVEHFLADDPALAKLVEQSKQNQWDGEVPIPLNKEHEMKTFEKIKQLLFHQKLFLALAVAATLILAAFRFDSEGVEWLWINSPAIGWVLFLVATFFWIGFLNVSYLLNRDS
jgi:hypothetical protein